MYSFLLWVFLYNYLQRLLLQTEHNTLLKVSCSMFITFDIISPSSSFTIRYFFPFSVYYRRPYGLSSLFPIRRFVLPRVFNHSTFFCRPFFVPFVVLSVERCLPLALLLRRFWVNHNGTICDIKQWSQKCPNIGKKCTREQTYFILSPGKPVNRYSRYSCWYNNVCSQTPLIEALFNISSGHNSWQQLLAVGTTLDNKYQQWAQRLATNISSRDSFWQQISAVSTILNSKY